MKLSILGARVIDPVSGLDQITDLHIEAGKLAAIGAAPTGFQPVQTMPAGWWPPQGWSTSTFRCASRVTAVKAASPAKPALLLQAA